MKLFALSLLVLAAFSYSLYQQREKITTLETALAASQQEVAKLQSALGAATTAAVRGQGAPGQISQPVAAQSQPRDGSWMFNKTQSSLDAPARRK